MYPAADLIPISALQHYLYCPRQCALIHLEQTWTENAHTAEGRILHEKAHSGKAEKRGDVKTVTSLLLCSYVFGLAGKADVVEFHRRDGIWQPFPVEYKRGGPKTHDADRIQLCAQAVCLEEMLDILVPTGALFYGKTRRRQTVDFDAALRESLRQTALAVHELVRSGVTPPPAKERARCAACSLAEECLPDLARRRSAARYLDSLRAMA